MNKAGPGSSNRAEVRAEAPERDLVLAAKAGDRDAFKVLAERHYRRVYRMLASMTRSEDDAADLTQETFYRALQALPSFNLTSSFYTWLYRIATNAALDRMRRARTAGPREEYDDALEHASADASAMGRTTTAAEPSRLVSTQEELAKVRLALDEIKPEYRQILVLRELEDLSYEEIASVLDLKIGTVMSRLFAARMKLREVLETKYGLKG
jgi:RNA polymerase sigma-70 factor (ECF subfamily)